MKTVLMYALVGVLWIFLGKVSTSFLFPELMASGFSTTVPYILLLGFFLGTLCLGAGLVIHMKLEENK